MKIKNFKLDYRIVLILIFLLGSVLRFYMGSSIPPGLYIDEASIGYNADEILKHGVDQYGYKYPLFFKSYGDYKLPVYVYGVSLSIAAFGRNDFAVRFPSELFGSLTIILFFYFIRKLLKIGKMKFENFSNDSISLLSTLFLAISP